MFGLTAEGHVQHKKNQTLEMLVVEADGHSAFTVTRMELSSTKSTKRVLFTQYYLVQKDLEASV